MKNTDEYKDNLTTNNTGNHVDTSSATSKID